jgi:hypothetical protein
LPLLYYNICLFIEHPGIGFISLRQTCFHLVDTRPAYEDWSFNMIHVVYHFFLVLPIFFPMSCRLLQLIAGHAWIFMCLQHHTGYHGTTIFLLGNTLWRLNHGKKRQNWNMSVLFLMLLSYYH